MPEWSLAPVVDSLQALRGIRLVAASTLVAELGCINDAAPIAVVIMLVDLDCPERGLIQVPVQPLVDVQQGIPP